MRGHHFDIIFYVQIYLLDEIVLVFPVTAFTRLNTSTIDNILMFISVFFVKALRKFTLYVGINAIIRFILAVVMDQECSVITRDITNPKRHVSSYEIHLLIIGQIPNNCVLKGMLQILDWDPDSN